MYIANFNNYILNFILFCLAFSRESNFKWERAPLETLRTSLFDNELCILYDGVNENGCKKPYISNSKQDNIWKLLPKVCKVSWARGDSCSIKSCSSCSPSETSRNLSNRPSVWNYWSGLPLSTHRFGYSGELLTTLRQYNIQKLVFMGDSMSHQMSRFFICDLIRRGVTYKTINATMFLFGPYSWNRMIWSEKDGEMKSMNSLDVIETDGNAALIDIYYKVRQIVWQCGSVKTPSYSNLSAATSLCNASAPATKLILSELRQSLVSYMVDCFKNHSSVSKAVDEGTVFVVNHGLHFPLKIFSDSIAEAVIIFAKYVRDQARRLNVPMFVIFRETTAQHFVVSQQGKYNKGHPNKCCGPTSNRGLELEDSVWLQDSLDRLAPSWRTVLGWSSAYHHTAPLYDLHLEGGDCTHFIWHPLSWDVMWWQLKTDVVRHIKDVGGS